MPGVQRLQFFLSESPWEAELVNDRRLELLREEPSRGPHDGGVIVIDDSGERKDGTAMHPFEELRGPRHRAVATPGDLLFHIRAARQYLCFALATVITTRLRGAVTVRDEVRGFQYFDERDLLGFVDGTENPTGARAQAAVLVGEEDPCFVGGSYVMVQKYLHDLDAWEALPVEVQERVTSTGGRCRSWQPRWSCCASTARPGPRSGASAARTDRTCGRRSATPAGTPPSPAVLKSGGAAKSRKQPNAGPSVRCARTAGTSSPTPGGRPASRSTGAAGTATRTCVTTARPGQSKRSGRRGASRAGGWLGRWRS